MTPGHYHLYFVTSIKVFLLGGLLVKWRRQILYTDLDNLLGITWHDSAWIPILNAGNVLDYFSERSNPFYDRTCNNEIVKMQRLSPEQLNNMTGLEYILLHVQEPILYVIRKQHRHSPTQVTPMLDYYIIAGIVYQAPDLSSVINSRLLNTVNHMQSGFDEVLSYSRYHPSKGYTWEFKDKDLVTKLEKKKEKKEEPSSIFQRQRVDMLLVELARRFPLRVPQQPTLQETMKTSPSPVDDENPKSEGASAGKPSNNSEQPQQQQNSVPPTNGTTIKQEKPDSMIDSPQTPNPGRIKPPPEKRARIAEQQH